MTLEVQNPSGYNSESLSIKFIQALYGETMEDFVARLAKEAAEAES